MNNIEKLKTTGLFTNYIYKAIPLAFDESMSYYETLCGLLSYLKDTVIPTVNNNADAVIELQNLYTQLKDFVDNYFDNLDVQEEINNKLDSLVADGTLTNLIETYINPYIEAQNEQINNQNTKINNLENNIQLLSNPVPIIVSSTDDMTDTSKIYVLTTNGYIYTYNGTEFVSSGILYGLNENSVIGYSTPLNSAENWSAFNSDCDNLTPNRIYQINYSTNINNLPLAGFFGTIIALSYNSNINGNGYIQLGIRANVNPEYYYRIRWGGAIAGWTSWKKITTLDEVNNLISTALNDSHLVTGSNTILNQTNWATFENDCNNLTTNKIYRIDYNTNIQNLPVSNFLGTLIGLNYTENTNIGKIQIAIQPTNNTHIFYRTYWGGNVGGWTSWKELADISYIDSISENIPQYTDELYKSFARVGIIGDSLASGEVYYKTDGTAHGIDMYDLSWGQFMARDSGNKYINFSKGGLSTRTWLTNSEGWTKASNPDNICDAYICGLGVNDSSLGSDYIGTISDIDLTDYNNNADTFYGNYGKIIQKIKELYPKVKFFILNNPRATGSVSLAINTAISEIVNLFDNVYLIDLYSVRSLYNSSSFIGNQLRNGHYNTIAYQTMAKILERLISRYMKDNYTEFQQIEFINTNYEWTD